MWASIVVAHGLSSCGSRALECRLSSCGAWALLLRGTWDLPGPGLEPVSPALAGGFLTPVPPGKPQDLIFLSLIPVVSSMEVSLSCLYCCRAHEDGECPFSCFVSSMALSMLLDTHSKHSSVFVCLGFFCFCCFGHDSKHKMRPGWTGRRRRANFASLGAKREKDL